MWRVAVQPLSSPAIASLEGEPADARVEDVERVHRLPSAPRLLWRNVLGAVAVLGGQLAPHVLDRVLERHLSGVRVDAGLEGDVLVHHVAPKVRVAHAQRDRLRPHRGHAELALWQCKVDRDALEALADAPRAEGGRRGEAEVIDLGRLVGVSLLLLLLLRFLSRF